MAAEDDFHISIVVFHTESYMVPGLEASGTQEPTQSVRRRIQFSEGLSEAASGHDQSGLIGVRGDVCAWEHVVQGSRRYVGGMDPSGAELVAHRLQHFTTLMTGPATDLMLDEAALTMSAVLQPRLDIIEWLSVLDEFAASCPTPTREGILAHLIGDLGFIGDRRSYGDWRNSCLDRVISGRRGIPISLSVVVIEVARRLGIGLHGIGMPAHFLIGDPKDPDWFCDPFHAGEILDGAGARSLLDSLTHGQIPWHPDHLQPVVPRLVIARMLNNLKAAFTQRKDLLRLSLVMQMRITMPEFDSEREQAQRLRFVLN
jgi:hypothetical protein